MGSIPTPAYDIVESISLLWTVFAGRHFRQETSIPFQALAGSDCLCHMIMITPAITSLTDSSILPELHLQDNSESTQWPTNVMTHGKKMNRAHSNIWCISRKLYWISPDIATTFLLSPVEFTSDVLMSCRLRSSIQEKHITTIVQSGPMNDALAFDVYNG
jgi:hypothetical protein